MMGRSHALLGAVGYSILEPIARISVGEYIPDWINQYGYPIAGVVSLIIVALSPMSFTRKYEIMIPEVGGPGYKAFFGAARYMYNGSKMVLVCVSTAILLFCSVHYLYVLNPALFPSDPAVKFLLMVVAAGFALLPDMDEPNSTVSQMFGPVAVAFSRITRRIAGGHRNGTHSWILIVFGLFLGLLSQTFYAVAAILIVFSFILAGRMLMPISRPVAFYPAAGFGIMAAATMWATEMDTTPLLLAIPFGVFLHDLGDLLTNSGIRFFWPHEKKYALKWFPTNGSVEHMVIQPLLGLTFIGILVIWIAVPMFQIASTGDTSGIFGGYTGLWNAK